MGSILFSTNFERDEDVYPFVGKNGYEKNQHAEVLAMNLITRHEENGEHFMRWHAPAGPAGANPLGHFWKHTLDPSFDIGGDMAGYAGVVERGGIGKTPMWIMYWVRPNAGMLVRPEGAPTGWKHVIFGNNYKSSTGLSISCTTQQYPGFPLPYFHSDEQPNGVAPEYREGDMIRLLRFDRGPQFTTRETRYCMYPKYEGCPNWRADVKRYFLWRIHIVDYGGAGKGNAVDVWIKDDDEKKWTLLDSVRDQPSGYEEQFPNGINTIWFTGYQTGRDGEGPEGTLDYGDLRTSLDQIPLDGVPPVAVSPETGPTPPAPPVPPADDVKTLLGNLDAVLAGLGAQVSIVRSQVASMAKKVK